MIWPLGQGRAAARLVLEKLAQNHVRAIADIHATVFQRAWSDGEFYSLLGKDSVDGFVMRPLDAPDAVVAFVLTQSAGDQAEILTIAAAPAWQRHGLATRLLSALLEKAHSDRLDAVFLEVSESNAGAVALYKKLGFHQVASRPGYYNAPDGAKCAALVMRHDLD